MTPKQQYYEHAANTIIKNLKRRRMDGYYCPTAAEAAELAMSFIKPGMTVSNGGSVTLQECGITDTLRDREDITYLDRTNGTTPEEVTGILRQALLSDCYFMSTNAITMDGELVNVDGSGNRVAALIFGPREVIIVAGMNKVTADIPSARRRVRGIASSPNCVRLGKNTPCAATGQCGDCLGDDCICSQTVITRRSGIPGRIKVILAGEELGY
ncbi:MAG: lactate utilization protein [Lachnospiraceae bacterium]|nr:lactate utilization protein [Lachnospiraceae bacterium]